MTLSVTEIRSIQAQADCLHDAASVQQALDRMATAISADLADTLPVVLCVLNGGIIPTGHLLTRLQFPLEIGYLHATRYRGETTGGDLVWKHKPATSLFGRRVLLIDDLIATGGTHKVITEHGLKCEKVNKVTEGRPHIVDRLKNSEIDLIINTTEGKQAQEDSFSIRRSALQSKVFYTTTMNAAMAICDAYEVAEPFEVYQLQALTGTHPAS